MAKKERGTPGSREGRQINGEGAKDRTRATRLDAAQTAIGQFLRATREAQNLTQEQVSKMTRNAHWQLSRAAISAIERGQNFPGMEAMLALSNVLFVDPKELIERARLSTVVPLDISALSYDDLDKRASQFFWSGDFRKALAVWDAMLEKIALESPENSEDIAERLANLEVRRATALRRAGALLSAIATAERAIAISEKWPAIQASAYVSLASLQSQRGNTPLARDAAERAIAVAENSDDPRPKGWAWSVRAQVYESEGDYAKASEAYREAHRLGKLAGDVRHLSHNAGNIGVCLREQGNIDDARLWLSKAVEHARTQSQPALEASWLVELGRIAFEENQIEDGDRYADEALRIARPAEHFLTIFRAEWLKHRVARRLQPGAGDRHRLEYLRKLFLHLDQYEGIEEIREFKQTALRSLAADGRKRRR